MQLTGDEGDEETTDGPYDATFAAFRIRYEEKGKRKERECEPEKPFVTDHC